MTATSSRTALARHSRKIRCADVIPIFRRRMCISTVAFVWTFPASAHHSTAMFDMTKTVTLKGAIKAFHWTNSHCSFDVLVRGPNGDEEWSVQLGPPTRLYKEDWNPLMFKPGDAIIVVVHPMRNGIHRGLWITDTINGRKDPGTDSP